MPGTNDNLIQLIEDLESQKFNYVIGIIKKSNSGAQEKIDIYTNFGENPLDKLLKVLKEHKKALQIKTKLSNLEIEQKDNKDSSNDKNQL